MHFNSSRLASILLAWLLAATHLCAAEALWKAGVAKAIITPAEPLWLAGYANRDKPADGKVMDL